IGQCPGWARSAFRAVHHLEVESGPGGETGPVLAVGGPRCYEHGRREHGHRPTICCTGRPARRPRSSLIMHRETPEAVGAPGLSGWHPAGALLWFGLTVQGVNDTVNHLNDQGLYACGVEDIERQIDAAVTASRAALASVRAMPGSQDRADAAVRLSREL